MGSIVEAAIYEYIGKFFLIFVVVPVGIMVLGYIICIIVEVINEIRKKQEGKPKQRQKKGEHASEEIDIGEFSILRDEIFAPQFSIPVFDSFDSEKLITAVSNLFWGTSYRLFTEVFSETSKYMTVHQAKGLEWDKVIVSVTPNRFDKIQITDSLGFLLLQRFIFCRVLDIRVAQVMKADARQSGPFQHPLEHVQHAVR